MKINKVFLSGTSALIITLIVSFIPVFFIKGSCWPPPKIGCWFGNYIGLFWDFSYLGLLILTYLLSFLFFWIIIKIISKRKNKKSGKK